MPPVCKRRAAKGKAVANEKKVIKKVLKKVFLKDRRQKTKK